MIEDKHLVVGLLLGLFMFGWSMILTNFKLFDWVEKKLNNWKVKSTFDGECV